MNFDLADRTRSFRYAGRGLRTLVSTQHNTWIHATVTVLVLAAGLLAGLARSDWCFIVLAITLVWTAEALNTALEFLCDAASPEFHPLVEKAKDVAAAGVLLSAIGAAAVGLLVLGPPLLRGIS